MEQQLLLILIGVLLTSHSSQAQSGYNYVRPELGIGASNAILPTGSTAVRPVVPPATISSNNPAYGLTGAAAAVNPATAYGSVFKPTAGAPVPATAYAAGVSNAAGPKIALQPQRPTTGIYGNIALGTAQPKQQYSARSDGDYADGDYSAIPGVPGADYPIYAEVPPTNFDCAQQPLPGYYSDVEAQCQVFHICALNRTYSFLCPNGTIFSQATLVCVWWNQYDCGSAPSLYANNAFIYDYGTQGAPSNAGYSPGAAQVGIGGGIGSRAQSNFQATSNAGRNTGAPTATGIYGSAAARPTVPAFPTATGNAAVGRYTPTATAQASGTSFPVTGSTRGTATPFGATAFRGDGYSPAIQETAYSPAQISPKSSNREYLPPSQAQ